ncbi:TldD/PmbA family protein [Fusibacter tunisiensis]|uniref:TldD protein n=1 Tax=Fusibacter tunisiensis TaxID=1008308 RepID=A0ABS2MMQ3_9FIRM|nr:TldD/PmbA family protein [Fusibacter tunisiensis]MBM7560682.1 TldD protein [Fusibacter tunisiensis]
MYIFPKHLYTDVRIEETFETKLSYKKEVLQEQKVRNNKGAFIRVFDGVRWFYASTTELDTIQAQIDRLASMATPNKAIDSNAIVKQFEVHKDQLLQYTNQSVSDIDITVKKNLLESYLTLIPSETVVHHSSYYVDNKTIKSIFSSKGTAVTFDKQTCGIRINLELAHGDNKDQTSVSKAGIFFDDILNLNDFFNSEFKKDIEFVKNAIPVEPGQYTVLLSPLATGVFTHESFGHKSESDFMVGDETMKAEWAIGKNVGTKILTIIDDGQVRGNGYVPYDDEGTKGKKTYIITEGKLTGRLHSTGTSASLEEDLTGNARAMNFEFEPIVRMTTTYIEKGKRPLADIISEIDKGIFVDNINHGSGMSTFTIAPSRAYMIENGKITKPVRISVITGNVFETLGEVDALSEEFELLSFVGGGCGKMEQWPLPVGFGGPYTRVRKLTVQ